MCLTSYIIHCTCAVIVLNMIFEWLPHLCTSHIQTICKVPQLSSTQFQPQRPGRLTNASQRRAPIGRWVYVVFFKADVEYPVEHGEVINYTLDGVSITKIQASFLSCRRGRKPLKNFIMNTMVTLKQLQSLMAAMGDNWGWVDNIVVTPQY